MKNLYLILLTTMVVIMNSCQNTESIKLQSGDLLFCGPDTCSKTGYLSKAIDEVTRAGLPTNYSHVGIVEVDENGIWVIHAEPRRGVNREAIESFLRIDAQGPVVAYRFKPDFLDYIPEALKRANGFVGQPYDFTYLLSDTCQYCSGLIYHLFEPFDVFELTPMTFLDPETGAFHPYWVDYFDRIGIEIPEGYLGCNPNGMAASEALEFLGKIKK
jgi:uncharacterized protein YycO